MSLMTVFIRMDPPQVNLYITSWAACILNYIELVCKQAHFEQWKTMMGWVLFPAFKKWKVQLFWIKFFKCLLHHIVSTKLHIRIGVLLNLYIFLRISSHWTLQGLKVCLYLFLDEFCPFLCHQSKCFKQIVYSRLG